MTGIPPPLDQGSLCSDYPVFAKDQTLTSADLEDLHDYLDEKDRTHNRATHRARVLCGLTGAVAAILGWELGKRWRPGGA